jgi:hypothetical protein
MLKMNRSIAAKLINGDWKNGEPVKTVTRPCKTCRRNTEQEKQSGGWYLCLSCLFNADSVFVPDRSTGSGGKIAGKPKARNQKELFV